MKESPWLARWAGALVFLTGCIEGHESPRPQSLPPRPGETRSAVEARLGPPDRVDIPLKEKRLAEIPCEGAIRVATHRRHDIVVYYDANNIVLCSGLQINMKHR